MSKLTHLQVNEALERAAAGESVRSIARELHVCESSIRWRFRKEGVDPKRIYRAAMGLNVARGLFESLTPVKQRAVLRELRRLGYDAPLWS